MGRLSAGVPPAPGVCWLASRARRDVCLCVHGMQASFGCRDAPCCSSVLLPCVSAHMSDKGGSHVVRPGTWSAASGFPFFWPPHGSLVA